MLKNSFYEHELPLSNGKNLDLNTYQNRVLLLVNTASHCGFTPQYAALERFYQQYKDRGFEIIAVPSRDFANQEFDNDAQTQQFCQINFGVSFPVVAQQHVARRFGKDRAPVYQWIEQQVKTSPHFSGWLGLKPWVFASPRWNFQKYLINRKGELVDAFLSTTKPESSSLVSAIERALKSD
jgi:glutathione peroxidase